METDIFSDQGRVAEITIDLVLRARAKMSENKVNRPDDAIVSEIIKQLPQEKIFEITRRSQARLVGLEEAPTSWRILKLIHIFAETRCSTEERDKQVLVLLRWGSLHVGAGQAVGGGHPGVPSTCTEAADSGCSVGASMAERDIILEALVELLDLDDSLPTRWPGPSDPHFQLSPTQPPRWHRLFE